MIRSVSNLPEDEALALLASAGRPLRPIAPGEEFGLSPKAIETLLDAGRQLRFGRSQIGSIGEQRFEELTDNDRQRLLALIADSMAAVALKGADQTAIVARLKLHDPDLFASEGSSESVRRSWTASLRPRPVRIAFTALAFGALALAEVVYQQKTIGDQRAN